MVINYLISLILLISPLMRASWDLWAQTVIHLLTLAALLILIFSKKSSLSLHRPIFPSLFFYLFFCFISIISSANFYESRNEFFNVLNYVVIFYFARNVDKKYIVLPVLISGIILSIYGFYQKFSVGGNVPSFMNNPNVFAGYLTGIIFITLSVIFTGRPSVVQNKTRIILLSVFFLAIFFTGSVASLLSVFLGFIFFICLKRITIQKKYLFLIVGITVFLLIVKLSGEESFNRIIWWLTAGKMILLKPLTGVGLGAFADAYQKYKLSGLNSTFAHNYFLQIAAETGIFGFLVLIWFLIKIFRSKKTSENIPFFAAIFAMLLHGIFDYALLIPANAILFWTMLGYCSKPSLITYHLLHTIYHIPLTTITRWISIFLISVMIYSSIRIFLGSRETAQGKYCLEEKKYDIAKKHFIDAIKYDDKNPQTYFLLSNVYQQYYKLTNYKSYLYEAEIELLKAAELQKYNSQIYFDLYSIYYIRGDMKNALTFMKKTIDSSPKSVYYEKCYETLLKEIYKKD